MLAEAHPDAAFADLVLPLVPGAQRLAYGMLQNAQEAEDAVQDATFKAWRGFGRFRQGSNARAWFLTIVANECRQRRRSRWWSIVRTASPPEPAPDRGSRLEAAIDIRGALSRLPPEMKLPFAEVGAVLRVSEKAAKARVHRALTRLRVDVPEVDADA